MASMIIRACGEGKIIHDFVTRTTQVFDVNTNAVASLKTGTAPSAGVTDSFLMYSKDQAAGNACPHFMTELSKEIKLYQRAHVADPTGGTTIDAEARTAINAILVTLESMGFHATV